MASSIKKNQQDYERAKTAYITANYEEAAEIIEKLAQDSPHDPEILLLRGHIYCYFQDFETAKEQYNLVIQNTDSEEYIECAHSGLETVNQWQNNVGHSSSTSTQGRATAQPVTSVTYQAGSEEEDVTGIWSEDEDWDFANENEATGTISEDQDPFANSDTDLTGVEAQQNPFSELSEDEMTAVSALNDDFEDENDEEVTNLAEGDTNSIYSEDFDHFQEDFSSDSNDQTNVSEMSNDSTKSKGTFLFKPQDDSFEEEKTNGNIEEEFDFSQYTNEDFLEEGEVEEDDDGINTFGNGQTEKTKQSPFRTQGDADPLGEDVPSSAFSPPQKEKTPTFQSKEASPVEERATVNQENQGSGSQGLFSNVGQSSPEGELFSHMGNQGSDLSFDTSTQENEPIVEQEQGSLAFLENASLAKKQQIISGAVGIASAIAVAVGSVAVSTVGENKPSFLGNLARSTVVGLVGGAASGAVTWVMGGVVVKQVKRSTGDLQAQLYAVQQGNLEAKATIYSQDEFGQLASGFNQMTRVVSTTTNEAQRKAQEQEQAKEDLQRQVIRLLDDVEGAARGDLTVQAQ
ncbi:MAG: HAMP domain-containing protein, partial [Halothece sp. Uz-M2-17]|nr:HAMP domain-containing protein [Halothece sp. Uz-M2-17]